MSQHAGGSRDRRALVEAANGTLQDEGAGLLFRNGTFAASVHYTLVTLEENAALAATVYNGVLRFPPDALPVSDRLGSPGQLFTLQTADGHRLACLPVQPLGGTRLRWLVRLK